MCARLSRSEARACKGLWLSRPQLLQTHLLTAGRQSAVTISGNDIRVRSLEQIDDVGVELWSTKILDTFPLDGETLAVIRETLSEPDVELLRTESASTFVFDALRMLKSVRAVQTYRKLIEFDVQLCHAAVEFITVGDFTYRCTLLHSRDPLLVRRAMSILGLEDQQNTNLPALLR